MCHFIVAKPHLARNALTQPLLDMMDNTTVLQVRTDMRLEISISISSHPKYKCLLVFETVTPNLPYLVPLQVELRRH